MELRAGKSEAAAAIWHWDAGEEARTVASDSPSTARVRGLVRGTVVLGVGALVWAFWSHTIAAIVFTVGGVVTVTALVSPLGLYAFVERMFAALGRATGQGLAWVLLVPIFYLFFLPFGRIMRRARRDRMKRFYDDEAPTYWEPRTAGAGSSRRRLY